MGRVFFTLSLALSIGFGLTQDLTADEVLAHLTARAESLQDASFSVSGRLVDFDGSEIEIALEVYVIPVAELARAVFLKPDALADNFIVLDGQVVYNYLFVTNQVTVLHAGDPDALGALFPAAVTEEALTLAFDLDRLFAGWQASVTGYGPSPEGDVYALRFTNVDPTAEVSHVEAEVVAERWVPYRLAFIAGDGRLLAEFYVSELVLDQGLDPDDLRYLPPDAEIIDER